MNGEIPLDEVYAKRLEIIRPTPRGVEALGAALRRVARCRRDRDDRDAARGAASQIHLVTAGIAQAILPLASHLGVPERAVHAVALRFDAHGDYEDFDRRSFLTRSGGKELVVRDVRARSHGKAAFVGDGVERSRSEAGRRPLHRLRRRCTSGRR